jgi:hypothetical protein
MGGRRWSSFDRELRLRDLDRAGVQGFVDWLTSQPARNGRLCDRSVATALTPLRAALDAAVAAACSSRTLPTAWCCRGGVAAAVRPARRDRAADSEAIALHWSDLELDPGAPPLRVSRAIVRGSGAGSATGVRTRQVGLSKPPEAILEERLDG